jgi:hypothetical protein
MRNAKQNGANTLTTPAPAHVSAGIAVVTGADDPDQVVGVPAGELVEWAWLTAELADWLEHAADTTQADFSRFFDQLRRPQATAVFLTQISERIAALLDGDRGQP